MKESVRHTALREFEAPTVHQLTLKVNPVSADSLVSDILDQFQSHADLPLLPVIGEGQVYLGSISRRHFLSFMTQAFARELFLRKSVTELLKQKSELAAIPMVVIAEERVDHTLRELLSRDPDMKYEALPVLEGDRFIGVVAVTDMMASLSESQEKLIEVMHSLSVRLNEEVAQAALLQRNLLPPSEIRQPGLRGSATLITSTEVGGDFFDYYCVSDTRMVLLIGDVSGHGVASGVLVSAAKAAVNLLSADGEHDPSTILTRLNHAILKVAHQRLLMTLFAACLDTQTGDLTYANAGHQFPYLYRYALGEMVMLETGGLPLGKSQDTDFSSMSTQMDVGDKLFLYTDGILEEENGEQEPFGYDRLEALLSRYFDEEPAYLGERLLEALREFSGKKQFADDVTVFCVEHHERRIADPREQIANSADNDLEVVRIAESFYRANQDRLIPRLSRQNLVFLAEQHFADLIPRFALDGIRRVLPRHNPTILRLGWKKLLAQHQNLRCCDLDAYLPKPQTAREFQLAHSADKEFVIEEVEAWLMESGCIESDRLAAVAMILDELIENGLYAAPRDGRGRALYVKGSERDLGKGEMLCLKVAFQDGLLGLHLQDSWGTLTPAVFLNRLMRHAEGRGLVAGVGGAGLYLIWRLGDYLQFRVHPHHQTQATVLLDLQAPENPDKDKGFQFIYHSEIHENLENEQFHAANYASAAD
ncbi:MAG: SpoIIE family protein phosphatase [Methylococcaceae bacterium]|nr:SpoIIE family protein phosphatase [Methylococcaceae bacterium]